MGCRLYLRSTRPLVSTGQILYFGGDEFSRVQQDANNVDQTCLYDSVMAVVSAPPPPASSIKAAAAMKPTQTREAPGFLADPLYSLTGW